MSDSIRLLTDEGVERFRAYLADLSSDPELPPPSHLLTDQSTSSEAHFHAVVDRQPNGAPFNTRYEFGVYLGTVLSHLNGAQISREYRMWNWLALYYFDQLCPPKQSGARKPLDNQAYILDAEFRYNVYYRHLVRTPWMAVQLHPQTSRVILSPLRNLDPPLATRGELVEQIASRQSLIRSPTVMAVAHQLYFDPARDRPRRGAGGSGPGSPRRFADVLNQFDLTYDLESVTPDVIIGRLPKEFERWRGAAGAGVA